MKCLIAFAGKPMPTFLDAIVNLSKKDGVDIKGAILTYGPGCYNLAIELEEQNDRYAEALTMALMPAKYCTTEDPRLQTGKFINEVEES